MSPYTASCAGTHPHAPKLATRRLVDAASTCRAAPCKARKSQPSTSTLNKSTSARRHPTPHKVARPGSSLTAAWTTDKPGSARPRTYSTAATPASTASPAAVALRASSAVLHAPRLAPGSLKRLPESACAFECRLRHWPRVGYRPARTGDLAGAGIPVRTADDRSGPQLTRDWRTNWRTGLRASGIYNRLPDSRDRDPCEPHARHPLFPSTILERRLDDWFGRQPLRRDHSNYSGARLPAHTRKMSGCAARCRSIASQCRQRPPADAASRPLPWRRSGLSDEVDHRRGSGYPSK